MVQPNATEPSAPAEQQKSFINETKNLLSNRKLTQETLLPILDSVLAQLQSPSGPPQQQQKQTLDSNASQQPAENEKKSLVCMLRGVND